MGRYKMTVAAFLKVMGYQRVRAYTVSIRIRNIAGKQTIME